MSNVESTLERTPARPARKVRIKKSAEDWWGTTAEALEQSVLGNAQSKGHYNPLQKIEVLEEVRSFGLKWDVPPQILEPAVRSAMLMALNERASNRNKKGKFIVGKKTKKYLEVLAEKMYLALYPPAQVKLGKIANPYLEHKWDAAEKQALAGYLHILLEHYYPR